MPRARNLTFLNSTWHFKYLLRLPDSTKAYVAFHYLYHFHKKAKKYVVTTGQVDPDLWLPLFRFRNINSDKTSCHAAKYISVTPYVIFYISIHDYYICL